MSIYNNSEKCRSDLAKELTKRYDSLTQDDEEADEALALLSEKTLHDFDIKENDQIE